MLWNIFGLKILIFASVNGRVEMWRRVWPSAVVPAASSDVVGYTPEELLEDGKQAEREQWKSFWADRM